MTDAFILKAQMMLEDRDFSQGMFVTSLYDAYFCILLQCGRLRTIFGKWTEMN